MSAERNFTKRSHRRLNQLTGEWVQVSPGRTKRPWQGQVEATGKSGKADEESGMSGTVNDDGGKSSSSRQQIGNETKHYDNACYLCPGNPRAGGNVNPGYQSTYVFDNDFAALSDDAGEDFFNVNNLLHARQERGICRVICFSPRHDLTLPEMTTDQIEEIVELWVEQYEDLGSRDWINWVQIFENKGAIMGCSNPHPHGQIWAQSTLPDEPLKEQLQQQAYFDENGSTLLEDYLTLELQLDERIVTENEDFVALVPFWAFWPFETVIISRRPFGRPDEMTVKERRSFADIIRRLTIRYDNIFNVSFPYSAGIHAAPTDGNPHKEWHFHMHFYPPLLRSATIKKFSVGYEMLAGPQRDNTPEWAAGILRDLSEVHYRKREPAV